MRTVLLNKLEEVGIEAGWATSFAEVRRGDDFRAVMVRAIYNTIRQLDAIQIRRRAIDRLKAAFASFSAMVSREGNAAPDLEALVAAIHRVNQKALPIAIVAAGLPTLPEALAEAKTYAQRLFSALIEKGVVYSVGRGELDFTVLQFAAFLRRHEGSAMTV